MYQHFFKRFIDIFLSVLALALIWPLLLVLVVWIKLDSPGPVLFKQKRIGKGCSHFTLLKFRTMRSDTPKDVPTHLLKKPEAYITRSGRFLRRSSLDELPQLFNILAGHMSLVGPRPALWNQDDLVAERAKYGANDVLPGLTGWAQINGRDELPIPVKARLDGEYVRRLSFGMDVKCILLTVSAAITGKGLAEGCAEDEQEVSK